MLTATLDAVADRGVLFGYSRLGYRLRCRNWPADDPPADALRGRVALVTGANSGLGQAAAAGLARLGAVVVMLVRDTEKGERARVRLLREQPDAELHVRRCDVAEPASVREAAAELRDSWPVVDVLVHNAGTMPAERTENSQGHELTLATHVLGPLLLTEQLRPALSASADARVVLVSSGGMYAQRLPADDIEYRAGTYRGAAAYARTKRVQVALTPLLARRCADDGIAVHAMHPGWATTPGVASSMPGFHRAMRPLLRDPAEGADSMVWLAATKPAPPSGRFWHDRRTRPTHYLPGGADAEHDVQQVWDYCRSAIGLADGSRQ